MDDILNNLGENMTCQDLYKSLTGYDTRQYSDDSDASSEPGISKYDHLEPPLYTYEELTNNTVGLERSLPMELSPNCADEERNSNCSSPSFSSSGATLNTPPVYVSKEDLSLESNTPAEKVAKHLSHLITVDFCFICSQSSHKHYKHEAHYKNVMKWLEIHTKEIMICNLPLSGHDEAKNHYDQKDHKEKSKSFCEVCLRAIEAIDMPNHCLSKKHLAKIESPIVHKSPPKENIKTPFDPFKQKIQMSCDVPPTSQISNIKGLQPPDPSILFNDAHQKDSSADLKSYASVLKGPEGKDSEKTTSVLKTAQIRKSELEALNAKYAMEEECGRLKRDMPAMFNPLAMMLVDQLRRTYCNLCHEPVLKGKGYHYKKKQHYEALRKWIEENGILFGYNMSNIESVICLACHVIFPTFTSAQIHYGTKEHEKASKYYCDFCLVHDNSDIHKNHKKRHSELDKGSNDEKVKEYKHTPIRLLPERFLRESIKNMLTESYCHICNTDNRDNHYLSRKHIEIFRIWLDTMILNSGALIPRSFIFCECCDLNLLETNESVNHYQTLEHVYNEVKFCEICIFRGSPEDMVHHRKSKIHYENYKYLPRSSRTTTESVSPRPIIEGCDAENKPGVFIVKQLNKMLSENHCQICETDNSNNHRFSKKHVQNLRSWLVEMMRNSGEKLNLRLIFCEECNMDLRGTEESASHYRTIIHLYNRMTYCTTCIFRGQPEEVVRHFQSDEHHETLRTLLANMGVTMKTPNGVSNEVVESTRDVRSVAGGKKVLLTAEAPEPKLHSTKENGKSVTSSDKKIVGLVHLGLKLGENAMKKISTKRKEHKICKDIFVEYWHLVTMLETVPLDVCLTYLSQFTKELGGTYKRYVHNKMDENQIKSLLMNYDTKNQSDQFSQDMADILNCESSKLRIIATTFLNNKYSLAALNEVRRIIMLVRNFKKAIEDIKADENSFKIDSVFQFNNTLYPYKVLDEILDTTQYEIYKHTLKNEIRQLNTFINTQKLLNRHVVLHCLAQFNSRLLREVTGGVLLNDELEIREDDDLNDEILADVELKTQLENKNVVREDDDFNDEILAEVKLKTQLETKNVVREDDDDSNDEILADVELQIQLETKNVVREDDDLNDEILADVELKTQLETKNVVREDDDLNDEILADVELKTQLETKNVVREECDLNDEILADVELKTQLETKNVVREDDDLNDEILADVELKTQLETKNVVREDDDLNDEILADVELKTQLETKNVVREDDDLNDEILAEVKLKTQLETKNVVREDDDDSNDKILADVELKTQLETKNVVREDDYLNDEMLADVELKTQLETANVLVIYDLEEHVSSIKNDGEQNVSEEIIINNDRKNENDPCFENAVECSCEGWCKQKNKN